MASNKANQMVMRPVCVRTREGWVQHLFFKISWTLLFYCVFLNHAGVDSRPQSNHGHHNRHRHQHDEDGSIRLVGGDLEGTGNVLVYHEGEWGAICDDGWNLRSAHIVCKSIGHPYALGYTNQAYFGRATHDIKLDDVRCYGDEPSILECDHNYWGQHNCHKSEAAGVFCAPTTLKEKMTEKVRPSPKTPKPTTPTTSATTTTTPIPTTTTSTPQAETPTLTDVNEPTFRNEVQESLAVDPRDILNPLNSLESIGENSLVNVLPEVIEQEAPVRLDDIHEEEDIAEFNLAPVVALDTDEDEHIEETGAPLSVKEFVEEEEASTAVSRNVSDLVLAEIYEKKKEMQKEIDEAKTKENEFIHETEKEPAPIQDPHHPSPYDLRIVNGRDEKEGRVEVHIGGIWALICSDNWNLLEARVACKQAGLGYAKMAAKGTYFGGSTMPKVIQGIKCDGTEDRLSDCYHERVGDVMCPEVQFIAGVVCSFELPDLVPNNTLLETSTYLQDVPMSYLTCAMEEGCAASSAYELQKKYPHSFGNNRRRLLRFSSSTWNYGTADFRPFIPKNAWEWHNCHMHYHSMEVFALYDLMDLNHNRVAEGHKASFCLEDVDCLPGKEKRYECVGYSDQGISVGCADTYLHNIDCQWIDISDLKVGKYIFRVHINPQFKVAELDYENNAASCDLEYTGYTAEVKNCAIGRGDHLPYRN